MVTLRPVTADLVESYRAVRLRALAEAPLAFGSTFAVESRRTDDEWAARVARFDGARATCLLAWPEGSAEPCGMAGGLIDEPDGARAELVSMWVDPAHRGAGFGRALVEAITAWASARGAYALRLMVTLANAGAIRFYERLGFALTGLTEPYPNDPSLVELEMIRRLD